MVSNWGYSCLAMLVCLVFRVGTVNWLLGSAVLVKSWQILCEDPFPIGVMVLISRMWLNYMHFVVQLEAQI